MKVVVVKSPKLFGGILRKIFGIKRKLHRIIYESPVKAVRNFYVPGCFVLLKLIVKGRIIIN